MLTSDSNPAKPAAIAGICAFCPESSALKPTSGRPISLPAKISWSIGEAMPITPRQADTFRHSTHQISQNRGVLCRSLSWALLFEILGLALDGQVQPSG